jgi:oxalate decarboxylase
LPKHQTDLLIASRGSHVKLPIFPNAGPHRFKLESIDPQVSVKGGTIAIASKGNFGVLEGITLFDLRLNPAGIREPHWHPNAAELDYVVSGKAKMVILSPHGDRDEFIVGEGDVVFIPPAYFHYIENIGDEEMHFAVFFNHESPEDIGISGAMGAYSNEVLSSVFEVDLKIFDHFPKPQSDVFVVSRSLF